MKERQRWRAEEDALLRAYVRQYGPREWHLVSQRMNTPLDRDAKSCLERWKNYLKPGIKKGSLTEEEQDLVIRLQAKHGNKWKKIAAEVPGRTAKRLGKWWEVFKEKQQRESKEKSSKVLLDSSEDTSKYDRILETFAEKLVKDRSSSSSCCTTPQQVPIFMGGSNNGGTGFIHPDPQTLIPPWLSNSSAISPNAPSVTLSLSPSTAPPAPPPAPPILHWLQPERVVPDNNNNNNSSSSSHSTPMVFPNLPAHGAGGAVSNIFISELAECCRELEEGQRAWAAHKKEAAWRLRRLELQLESEKACKRKEKMDEIEAKIQSLREEQKLTLERIEAEYKEQLAGLRWDAEAKEQKLAEQWLAKHNRLTKFLEQMGCRSRPADPNAR